MTIQLQLRPRFLSAAGTIIAIAIALPASAQRTAADPARLFRDISVLADDAWEGRQTCTPGNDSAAVYIASRFADLGLEPLGRRGRQSGPRARSRPDNYFHAYTARPAVRVHEGLSSCEAQNVAAVIGGSDPALAHEYVVIGAHFDHLGRGTFGALDPELGDAIRNGADDNASGTAAVLELARLFAAQGTRRSLIFVTFSGEEWGLLGSQEFAEKSLPAGRAQAMVNFDMVGRLRNDTLLVYGTGTALEMVRIIDSANTTGLRLAKIPDGIGPSDHRSFYSRNIPVLHLFTNTHADYHRASDDAVRINAPGTAKVVDYAQRVIRLLADRADSLTYVRQAERPVVAGSGTRPYLGSVPDMAAGDVPGQRISDVSPGSPGDKAGLRAGDAIVEFGGKAVTDLQSYSDALGAHKPGDTVTIVVIRGERRVTLTATLGARGG